LKIIFFVNGTWFKTDDEVIANAIRLKNIPGIIVQGRYDVVCPAQSAWDLHKVWPEAELVLVDDAGHSAREPGTTHELLLATDKFRKL